MPSVIFTKRAIGNLKTLRTFLDEKSRAATVKFQHAFRREIELLQSAPKMGRPIPDSLFRELVIRFGSSGYIIRYRENDNAIIIVAVKHQKQMEPFVSHCSMD